MARRYKPTLTLSGGHSDGITAVAFSPQGHNIATAGMDGHVCLWRARDGELLHRYMGSSPALSLAWVPSGDEVFLFGTRDGNITMFTVSSALTEISISGFWAHKYPVERLAIMGDYVASGAFGELKVWKWHVRDQRFTCERELSEPPKSSHNEHLEVLVTSLHWTGPDERPLLMITYMHHGVQVIDATTWQSVRSISLHGKIAHASLSLDGLHLAVSNLVKGFDVYRVDTEKPVRFFEHDVGKQYPTPVLFMHGGRAIVGGTTVGVVNVWDLALGKLHNLIIPGKGRVLALSAHCQTATRAAMYRFRIATGIFNEKADSSCIIWEAEHLDADTVASADDAPEVESPLAGPSNVHARDPPALSTRRDRLVMSPLLWAVASAVVVFIALAFVPPIEDTADNAD